MEFNVTFHAWYDAYSGKYHWNPLNEIRQLHYINTSEISSRCEDLLQLAVL